MILQGKGAHGFIGLVSLTNLQFKFPHPHELSRQWKSQRSSEVKKKKIKDILTRIWRQQWGWNRKYASLESLKNETVLFKYSYCKTYIRILLH